MNDIEFYLKTEIIKNQEYLDNLKEKTKLQQTIYKMDRDIQEINDVIQEKNKYKQALLDIKEYLEKNALAPIFLDCKLYETEIYKDLLEMLKGGSNE